MIKLGDTITIEHFWNATVLNINNDIVRLEQWINGYERMIFAPLDQIKNNYLPLDSIIYFSHHNEYRTKDQQDLWGHSW